MKQRLLFAGSGLAMLLVAVPQPARSSAYTVEPCLKSKLCSGLVEHFNMHDLSDYARYGAFGSVLHENIGFNIGSTAGKFGNAANFTTSTDYLWSSTFVPSMSTSWSVSFWFRASSLPGPTDSKTFISRAGGDGGSVVYLGNSLGTTYLCMYTVNRDGTTPTATCNSTAISINTTYHVAAGVGDPDDTPGSLQAWVSVNGGAKAVQALNYVPFGGLSHLRVGQAPSSGKSAAGTNNYSGWIDELSIFSRSIGPSDIALLWNGSSGRQYPFVTE